MAKMVLEQQVRTFLSRERASYEKFGELLKEVLCLGARTCTSGSTVSVRVKAPASFAEKCIRKSGKYDDPVYELTDLCGARVMTYTLDEVERLCNFVEHYFVVDRANSEDKLSLLRTGEFAYRSVHYVVQIDPERFRELGLSPQKIRDWEKLINRPQEGKVVPFYRKAEIQLQTYLQHVWAETMHNRTYKTGIRLPQPLLRESYRIAALLEKADEDLRILSGRIDAFARDYAAHLSPEALERELNIVKILIGQEGLSPEERENVSLRLLELLASANRWEEVLSSAKTFRFRGKNSKFFNELDRLEATALCRVHRANPGSKKFRSGLSTLMRLASPVALVRKSNDDSAGHIDEIAEALACSVDGHGGVTRDVPHAAVMAELAQAYFYDTTDAASAEKARAIFLQAHLLDPQNPYLFCDYL
jgi:ppGpp synthetase/RelA/SpoT-type nucleotidyltranferase